jgi:heat shock protein HslJ
MKYIMVFLVLIIILSGCLTVASCAVKSPLEDYIWILTGYNVGTQNRTLVAGTELTAVFNSTDRVVRGSGGCNSYSANYTESGLTLTLGPLTQTKISCSPEKDAQEQEFFSIIGKAERFELDHGNLFIFSGMNRLVFRRQGAGKTPEHWGG